MRIVYDIMGIMDNTPKRDRIYGKVWTKDYFEEINKLLESGMKFVLEGKKAYYSGPMMMIPIPKDQQRSQIDHK